jgi:hypothetical protein
MTIRDLDGNSHAWHLTGHMAKGRTNYRSSYHLKARALIGFSFPTLQILEEVPIVLRKNDILYLDFYLPLTKTCIEVHGEQHYKFVPFYHHTPFGFARSQKRDREKTEWCDLNDIKQIILPYDEDEDQWKARLLND